MDDEMRFYAVILSGIMFVVFLVSLVVDLSQYYLISSEILVQPWTIITHMFLHNGFLHLIYNLGALAVIGSMLEKVIGSNKFLAVFFISGVASSVADVMFYPITLGASGAVFGVIGMLAVLRPKWVIWAFGVPMYVIVAAVLWALVDMAGILYPDNVAHAAHLFGMGFGVVAGIWYRSDYKDREPKKSKDEIISEEEIDRWEDTYMGKR